MCFNSIQAYMKIYQQPFNNDLQAVPPPPPPRDECLLVIPRTIFKILKNMKRIEEECEMNQISNSNKNRCFLLAVGHIAKSQSNKSNL